MNQVAQLTKWQNPEIIRSSSDLSYNITNNMIIARKFHGELNLVIWQLGLKPPQARDGTAP